MHYNKKQICRRQIKCINLKNKRIKPDLTLTNKQHSLIVVRMFHGSSFRGSWAWPSRRRPPSRSVRSEEAWGDEEDPSEHDYYNSIPGKEPPIGGVVDSRLRPAGALLGHIHTQPPNKTPPQVRLSGNRQSGLEKSDLQIQFYKKKNLILFSLDLVF